MFSKRLLMEASTIARNQARKLVKKIDNYAAKDIPFDLQKCFYAFTMDTFAAIAFGVEFESQDRDHPFTLAFDNCQR